jgi:hypothetical protein
MVFLHILHEIYRFAQNGLIIEMTEARFAISRSFYA